MERSGYVLYVLCCGQVLLYCNIRKKTDICKKTTVIFPFLAIISVTPETVVAFLAAVFGIPVTVTVI